MNSDVVLRDLQPGAEFQCITEHPGFKPVCLESGVYGWQPTDFARNPRKDIERLVRKNGKFHLDYNPGLQALFTTV